ncbi:MAG: hypothetical protein PHI91_01615 [Candidatus Pacebacteria bacterium]|jgi:hypothetical protein|nr:hypothetical protein [Candidatus Paceibacterota bacterium]MDD2757361.1 hypothetical protein [Candidatus Paceibacterota bacterium]MDD3283731.1 hypothetical protein [Candidatus Paceibacterota bacterium]MDD3969879.1 hypothetical protein [Candidatus Paceibacterota bacterium]MDD4737975.1 hypothetical protein [Candidatus Paceibacterota bacterium]
MSIENPFKNEESKFDRLTDIRKQKGLPDEIVERRKDHHKDIIIEVPKGYDSKKRIEKIIEQRRIEKENN